MRPNRPPAPDTVGLSAAGIWVRRIRTVPSLSDEALSLARVMQTWSLSRLMTMEQCTVWQAEVSSPGRPADWLHLVEVLGMRTGPEPLLTSHPLSQILVGGEVRILALVQPPTGTVACALVETPDQRRLIALRSPPTLL